MRGRVAIDIAGQRFGQWTVMGRDGAIAGAAAWLCRCDCGTERTVKGGRLRAGHSTSCGCGKHGRSRTRLWGAWWQMRQRCTNPNDASYPNYGGRGIFVCERWLDFENFLADMGERPEGMSLDRVDNDGPYSPANCRWATRTEQSRNTRRNRYVEVKGKRMLLADAARLLGISGGHATYRLQRGQLKEVA